jgi:hypothetical protein
MTGSGKNPLGCGQIIGWFMLLVVVALLLVWAGVPTDIAFDIGIGVTALAFVVACAAVVAQWWQDQRGY